MRLEEALKTNYPFKRKAWKSYLKVDDNGELEWVDPNLKPDYQLRSVDILADDWEVDDWADLLGPQSKITLYAFIDKKVLTDKERFSPLYYSRYSWCDENYVCLPELNKQVTVYSNSPTDKGGVNEKR